MDKALLVGLGGFIGSVGRYALGGALYRLFTPTIFPFATLVVNVLGCFLIGLLGSLAEMRGVFSSEARAFAFIGILGGFTTFSTFGYETLALLRGAELERAALNVLSHVTICLLAVWFGDGLGRVL